MITVLITSAGRRNQLIDCFRRSAGRLSIEIRIVAVDVCPQLSSACASADISFAVPHCKSEGYIEKLIEICSKEKVDILVPTIDPELLILSCAQREFTKYGTRVVISSPEVVKLAGDKYQTAMILSRAGISVPKTLTLKEYLNDPGKLLSQVIAKPIAGSSSVGLIRPKAISELFCLKSDQYVVQELWSGSEYTVNMFFDRNGVLQCSVPHLRLEVRGGEVSKARTELRDDLMSAAQELSSVLTGARGPICFQAIVERDGRYCIFEINARFGGGYPLADWAGAPFTQWLLEEQLGRACTAHQNWETGTTMLRYDVAVFTRISK